MNLTLVSRVAVLATGSLLFVQSLADVIARRRFWYSVATLVGSTTLLVGVGIRTVDAGGIPSGETSLMAAVLIVAGCVAVVLGTTRRLVGQTRS